KNIMLRVLPFVHNVCTVEGWKALVRKQFGLVMLSAAVPVGFLYSASSCSDMTTVFDVTINWTVVIIFLLLSGFLVDTKKLKNITSFLPSIVLTEVLIVGLFPLVGLFVTKVILKYFIVGLSHQVKDGIITLSCLPTTIATAVAFTSTAKGNQLVALVNCTLSSILGWL
ncbi:hypothetical protein RFI_17993, partial [Reticulomyxa filosa]